MASSIPEKVIDTNMAKHEENVDTAGAAHELGSDEKDMPLGQAIRRYPKIAGYSLCITLAILLWGYDLVIVGTVSSIPAFQYVFGEPYDDRWIIPSSWYAAWQVSTNIGLMLGAIFCGWLQDQIGRRWSLFSFSMTISAAVAICYVSDLAPGIEAKRGLFFVAKTVQGFGIGGLMPTTQTWMSEVLPVSLRGPIMAFFPIFKLLGQLIGALVSFGVIDSASPSAYRLCFATQWPFSGVLAILAMILPESPAFLLRKEKTSAARHAMSRLRGGRRGRSEVSSAISTARKSLGVQGLRILSTCDIAKSEAEAAFDRLCEVIEEEKHGSNTARDSYVDCFKQPELRRLLIICFAECMPLLFGLSLLGSSSYFLQQIGMDPSTSVIFLIVGIALGMIASCISVYTTSKLGRRTLILGTMSMITVVWLGVGISGAWRGTSGSMWFTAVGAMVVTFIAGAGVWPASYAIASEVSSIRLRSKAQGIAWLVYGLGTMVFGVVLPYLYNPDAADIGSYCGFVYTGFAGIGVVITFFHVPELKGRPAHEIDRMFDFRLKARAFKRWSDSEAAGLTSN